MTGPTIAAPAAPFPPVDGTQPCLSVDPELFFPNTGRADADRTTRARACCHACPFRTPCLAYALGTDVAGVWGGLTAAERQDIRRRRGIRAASVLDSYRDVVTTWPTRAPTPQENTA